MPGSIALNASDRSIEVHVCHSPTRELEVLQDYLLGLFAARRRPAPGDVAGASRPTWSRGAADRGRLRRRAARAAHPVHDHRPRERSVNLRRGAAGPAGAGRRRAAAPATCSRCCSSRWWRAASGWTTTRWRRCTSGCARPACIGRWMRRSAPASTCRRTAPHARRCAAAAVPGLRDACGGAEPFDDRLGAGDAEGSRAAGAGRAVALSRPRCSVPARRCSGRAARAGPPRCSSRSTTSWTRPTTSWTTCASCASDPPARRRHARRRRQRSRCRWPWCAPRCSSGSTTRRAAASPGGGLNFASMSSLRGLPFGVVCAIGLNDGAFPAAQRPLEFDLMALHPRRGDRQRRARRARPDARPAARRARAACT